MCRSCQVSLVQPLPPAAPAPACAGSGEELCRCDDSIALGLFQDRAPLLGHRFADEVFCSASAAAKSEVRLRHNVYVQPGARAMLLVLDHLPGQERLPHQLVVGLEEEVLVVATLNRAAGVVKQAGLSSKCW